MISTHVLDTSTGRPASGVNVTLERRSNAGDWVWIANTSTGGNGRAENFIEPHGTIERGVYRLSFETGAYFATVGRDTFYPEVRVVFEVRDPGERYHLPLLLSAFGYSTYRGT